MQTFTAILTLFLVMDPIGGVPVFLGYLKDVDESRRPWVVARESIIALLVLMFFLFFGPTLLAVLEIRPESLHIAGGVVLFLVAIGMIFPGVAYLGVAAEDKTAAEPFIVPLAIPLLAGPSTMTTLMIFSSQASEQAPQFFQPMGVLAFALLAAWVPAAVILIASTRLSRILGRRGLMACERLMGMILTVLAVQMFLTGVRLFRGA